MDEVLTKDERLWGMFCHLSAFAFFVFPFGNIIGPLVLWLIKRDESAFADDQGKESLNFQITMTLYFLISLLLALILIGFLLMLVVFLADFILVIIASIKSSEGERYSYPLSIRIIK